MKIDSKHIIIYAFQSLEDPLVKGLILEYLQFSSEQKFAFHLITHEQKEFSLSPDKIAARKAELRNFNIEWYPVKYRGGSLLIFKKIYNFIETLLITREIKRKYNPIAIVGFLAIAGGYSYILARLFKLKLIVYCFEPHSEYMVDFKIWKSSGLKYKLLKKFEALQVKNAKHIVVPNNSTKLLVQKSGTSANVLICPISINTNSMVFDPNSRTRIRKSLNAEDKTIVIYTGKFGGIYYSADEVAEFFSKLYNENKTLFFYVITPNTNEVNSAFLKYKLPPEAVSVSLTVSYSELNQFVSAADIGFVALPSLPSQKYRTPVKTAIYLSCGLPYIVNKGIGEDDIIAVQKKLGIVIQDLNESPKNVVKNVLELLSEDKEALNKRCRNEAVSTRSIEAANAVLQNIFFQL